MREIYFNELKHNINFEEKYIFIHIPKTAGISISRALKIKSPKHLTIQEMKYWMSMYSKEDIDSYFKFAFVRNPWDRFLSLYFYSCKGSDEWELAEKDKSNETLNDFCRRLKENKPRITYAVWPRHYEPQSNFIRDAKIDYIGRFENLNEDFLKICDKLNKQNITLKHINSTNRKHYSLYYDQECIDFVSEYYKEDIENFGYDFKSTLDA